MVTEGGVPAIASLRRHQLLRLSAAGWSRVRAGTWHGDARDCLAHWAAHDLPLVVARQRAPQDDDATSLDLGLPAPARWGRQRLSVRVHVGDVRAVAAFPSARAIAPLLPPAARAGWAALVDALAALGVPARVYGSFGWQSLSGLDGVRDGSDVDLLLPVDNAATADAVAAQLLRVEHVAAGTAALPRLDGELEWPDGSAVAWREWHGWRRDGGRQPILVKRIDAVALAAGPSWLDAATRSVRISSGPVACTG